MPKQAGVLSTGDPTRPEIAWGGNSPVRTEEDAKLVLQFIEEEPFIFLESTCGRNRGTTPALRIASAVLEGEPKPRKGKQIRRGLGGNLNDLTLINSSTPRLMNLPKGFYPDQVAVLLGPSKEVFILPKNVLNA